MANIPFVDDREVIFIRDSSDGPLGTTIWSSGASPINTYNYREVEIYFDYNPNGEASPATEIQFWFQTAPTAGKDIDNSPIGYLLPLFGQAELIGAQVGAETDPTVLVPDGANPERFNWTVNGLTIRQSLIFRVLPVCESLVLKAWVTAPGSITSVANIFRIAYIRKAK